MQNPVDIINTILPYFTLGILIIFLVSGKFKRIKLPWLEIESKEKKAEINSLIHELNVKVYSRLWELIKIHLLSDIRYRVRKNGWLSIANWKQYVEDAITAHHNFATGYLDDNYSYELKVDRINIYEHNRQIEAVVTDRYRRMYDDMKQYSIDAKAEALKLEEEMTELNGCVGNGGRCARISDIMYMTRKIIDIERIELKEKCMNEAQRALEEITHLYTSHFLSLYAKTVDKRKKH